MKKQPLVPHDHSASKALSLANTWAQIFGAPIELSGRAAAALSEIGHVRKLFGKDIALRGDLEVFAHTVANSPACADILLRHGLSLSDLPGTSPIQPAGGMIDLTNRDFDRQFSELFGIPLTRPRQLNRVGGLVSESGLMTNVDLFAAVLESGHSLLTGNQTAQTLLRPRGLADFGVISPEGADLLEKMAREALSLGRVDPSHAEQQFLLFLDEGASLRIRPFGATALGRLDERRLPEGPFVFRGGTLQALDSQSPFANDTLGELEELLNASRSREQDFQTFFEQHPALLAGLDFGRVHPQPILYKDDGSRLIPDFFLEKVDVRWDAILELKRPDRKMVVRRRNRVYFAQWVQEAISQLRYYRDWFGQAENRSDLERRLNLPGKVYRPKMVLVAGRAKHFASEVERIRLTTDQGSDLELWTYDDVVSRARRYTKFLREGWSQS